MTDRGRDWRKIILRGGVVLVGLLLAAGALRSGQPAAAQKEGVRARNVVLVLIDGLRWQEVFTGADAALMTPENGVPKADALKKSYWREDPDERRKLLMPFLWTTVARQGQLWGNRGKGSPARVTNQFHFSYPGYSEMTVGYADPRIDSNDKRPNPNVTVFEWLNRKPKYRKRVAVFGAWDTVAWIVNRERCGFFVNAGFEPVREGRITPRLELLNRMKAETPRYWDEEPYDAMTVYSALEYLKANRPRAMWLTLGETDEWAHEARYGSYLDAIHYTDGFLRELWSTLQSLDQYRGKTTLIVAVDHGRGVGPKEWRSHGAEVPGSDQIWMAALGPDTPALGERQNVREVRQCQIAATVAAALGEDYPASEPRAAPPIEDAIVALR